MPHARATEPIDLWVHGQPCFFQIDEVVDGDVAVFVLSNPDLPFEEIPEDKPPRGRKKPDSPAGSPADSEIPGDPA